MSKRFAFRRKREKIRRIWNCPYLNLFQFHLLIIRTWCHEFNLATESFPYQESSLNQKIILSTFSMFAFFFLLLHLFLWGKILSFIHFFLLKVTSFFEEIMLVLLTLLTTKNCLRNFHFPSNYFSFLKIIEGIIKSLLLLDIYAPLN